MSDGPTLVTRHPVDLSVLYTMLPASLRRRLPRLNSFHRSILSSQDVHAATLDLHRGLQSASETQLEYYEAKTDWTEGHSRPATADGRESIASSSAQTSGTSTPEAGPASALSSYEADSGLRWNRVVPAFNLLRSAGFEAQQPSADTRLVRSLYINGLAYLLEALPPDLSRDEVRGIQERLPDAVKASFVEGNQPAPPNTPGRLPAPNQSSYLHRIIATCIVYGFIWLHFLIPYARTLLQSLYRYERHHRFTERILAATLHTADNIGKGSHNISSILLALSEGRVGAAITNLTAWLIESVAGGVYDGVGEGLVVLGAIRPNTDLQQRSSF